MMIRANKAQKSTYSDPIIIILIVIINSMAGRQRHGTSRLLAESYVDTAAQHAGAVGSCASIATVLPLVGQDAGAVGSCACSATVLPLVDQDPGAVGS